MWIQAGALPRVPEYAVVRENEVEAVLRELSGEEQNPVQARLDLAFKRLEREQPELAAFLGYELANLEGQPAQGLLYMLFLAVFLAFRAAFGARLHKLEASDINAALEQLIADSEIRSESQAARGFSEDAVAIAQPALMRFVNAELEHHRPPAEAVPPIVEALLVAVLALQAGVAPR